jgi:voltage-gated potassium channel
MGSFDERTTRPDAGVEADTTPSRSSDPAGAFAPADPTEPGLFDAILTDQRLELLRRVQAWLEIPMLVLALVWLVLLVIELVRGLTPFLEVVGYVIWGAFILEFALGFVLAPRKLDYVKANWLSGVALLVPALRVFRVVGLLRAARVARLAGAARGLRLVRVLTSLNRGMRALGSVLGRHGFGYVVALTAVVTLVGAAGMYAFERERPGRDLDTYGEAVWWTAMIMTTMGSEYWPRSPEGRVLCVVLSLYAFAVFGYVTATLATFLVQRDADRDDSAVAGGKSIEALRAEIAALREAVIADRQRGGPAESSLSPVDRE